MDKSLPFELIALEWALATAAQFLAAEVRELQSKADLVIDKVTKKVCKKSCSPCGLCYQKNVMAGKACQAAGLGF